MTLDVFRSKHLYFSAEAFLADTEAELTHFIIETNHRLMSLQAQLSKAWRMREEIRHADRGTVNI